MRTWLYSCRISSVALSAWDAPSLLHNGYRFVAAARWLARAWIAYDLHTCCFKLLPCLPRARRAPLFTASKPVSQSSSWSSYSKAGAEATAAGVVGVSAEMERGVRVRRGLLIDSQPSSASPTVVNGVGVTASAAALPAAAVPRPPLLGVVVRGVVRDERAGVVAALLRCSFCTIICKKSSSSLSSSSLSSSSLSSRSPSSRSFSSPSPASAFSALSASFTASIRAPSARLSACFSSSALSAPSSRADMRADDPALTSPSSRRGVLGCGSRWAASTPRCDLRRWSVRHPSETSSQSPLKAEPLVRCCPSEASRLHLLSARPGL
mmetsp:Transcript_53672/g.117046  ORF Transcript_53672/g.117046 Transcript_53672/m.117046 type:complete len:323 (-) Transcript_53672:456-1424(-)